MKSNIEQINDLLDDNLSHGWVNQKEVNQYIDEVISDEMKRDEFSRLCKLNFLIQQSGNTHPDHKLEHIPEQLLNIDISDAVSKAIIEPESIQKELTDKQSSNNVISFFKNKAINKPLVSFAIAASILFISFGFNFSQFFTTNEYTGGDTSNYAAKHSEPMQLLTSHNLVKEQQLIQQEIIEKDKNLQQTLLEHRLLQQGFFPSELTNVRAVSNAISSQGLVTENDQLYKETLKQDAINFYHNDSSRYASRRFYNAAFQP